MKPEQLKVCEALIYRPDGTISHDKNDSNKYDGADLRKLIGCQFFTCIELEKYELWMNEEGIADGEAYNQVVTDLFKKELRGIDLHGNVMVVRKGSVE